MHERVGRGKEMKTMAQIIIDELKVTNCNKDTYLVCSEKGTERIKYGDYFILVTRMFNRFGYQTWKDNKLVDYERCHLKNPGEAELNAKLHIVGEDRLSNELKLERIR